MQSQITSREATSVLAVVVTRQVTPWLASTLAALAAQEVDPSRVLVAVWDPSGIAPVKEAVLASGLYQAEVIAVAGSATFGQAVKNALQDHPATPGQWLWLLHDDSAPMPTSLAALVRAVEQGSSIVVAGSKQVEWSDPDQLISVGVGLTASGRRFTALEDGEIDQGQHDDRADVLAVGSAGMFVRRDMWDDLRGFDPRLGPYGDGAELSRRARLAGHRVIVVPDSVVRHARASYQHLRTAKPMPDGDILAPEPVRSWPARRAAILHQRLAGATPVGALLAFIAMFVLAPVRALARVATKEFHLIGAELRAPFVAAAGLGAVRRSRAQARRTAVVSRRVLRSLQVGWTARASAWRDLRLQRAAQRRSTKARSELEKSEAASAARRRRAALTALLVTSSAIALVTVGGWIFAGPLTGGGLLPIDASNAQLWKIATSPWLAVGDGHPTTAPPLLLVLAALTTLIGGLWGTPVTATVAVLMVGALPLAALGAWFAAGAATRRVSLRFWVAAVWALAPPLLIAVAQGRIGAVVAHLALPWVVLGVVRALGIQSRDQILSGMVGAKRLRPDDPNAFDDGDATEAGATPLPAEAVAQDPSAQVQPTRLNRPAGSIGAAAAAGLVFAIACAGAPILLPIGILAVVLLMLTLPSARRGVQAGRARLLLVLAPALVLLGPWLTSPFSVAANGELDSGALESMVRLVVSDPGVATSFTAPAAWQQALTWPVEPAALPGALSSLGIWAPFAITVPLLIAALVALLRGGARGRAARIGWLLAALGLAVAGLTLHIPAGTAASGVADVAVPAWSGAALSFFLLALLVAIAASGDGLQAWLGRSAFGWRQPSVLVLTAVMALAPILGGVAWVWSVRGDSSTLAVSPRGADPVPALGRQQQDSPAATRVLAITPTADGYDIGLWRNSGPQFQDAAIQTLSLQGELLTPTIAAPDEAATSLATAVARLSVAADEAVPALQEHAVSVIVVPPLDSQVAPGGDETARARLVASLDATAGLEPVTTNASGTIWRVIGVDGAARVRVLNADGTPSAQVQAGDGDLPVGAIASRVVRASGEIEAADADRTVVLAERASSGWRASVDGVDLDAVERTDGEWRQMFVLPAGTSGTLTITYFSQSRSIWIPAQIAVFALAALLALPTRRRRPWEDA